MAAVGLLYVGAILFLNGTMLLGWVDGKSAAPLNVFVGFLQVRTPTYLIISADGDQTKILAASGLYLFGFTYLYVGWNLLGNLDGTGLGMFSLFVAVSAVVYSIINFDAGDPVFGVIWLYWSFLWLLFYLLLGRKQEALGKHRGGGNGAGMGHWCAPSLPAVDGSPRLHRGQHLRNDPGGFCRGRVRCAVRPDAPAQDDASGRHGAKAGVSEPTPPPSRSTETKDGLCPRICFR